MNVDRLLLRALRRFLHPIVGFVLVMAAGTLGYRVIGGPQTALLDAAYMTFITIATIGFGEVVDLTHSPGGRVFTMLIASAGILNFTYMMSVLTAFLVEVDFNEALRRRRMQKQIGKLHGHYIVCGIGRVGANVTNELAMTARKYVVIDVARERIDAHLERYPDACFLHGDAGDDELLARAGVARASGVFAITGDDSKNLVIVLSAKHLNPAVRVVARCHDVSYMEKIRRVGADDIVSPDFTGGLRIASSMIRPHVVSFLDEMLRTDGSLRVEEIPVPAGFAGLSLGTLNLNNAEYMLLAVRDCGSWRFNPQPDYELKGGDMLIVMTSPLGRNSLERIFAG